MIASRNQQTESSTTDSSRERHASGGREVRCLAHSLSVRIEGYADRKTYSFAGVDCYSCAQSLCGLSVVRSNVRTRCCQRVEARLIECHSPAAGPNKLLFAWPIQRIFAYPITLLRCHIAARIPLQSVCRFQRQSNIHLRTLPPSEKSSNDATPLHIAIQSHVFVDIILPAIAERRWISWPFFSPANLAPPSAVWL